MAFNSICRSSKRLFSTTATPTPFPTFRAAKSAILSERDPEKLAKLLEQNSQFPTFRRHRPIFHRSIRKLSLANRPDLIHHLLRSQLNYDHSDSSNNSLNSEGFWIRILMLYSRAGMVDHAMETLHHYCEKNYFQISEKSLCAILSVCLNNGMFDQVHQLFDTMPHRLGVSPGVVSNNLVLKAFVKEGKIESAREWIARMERDRKVAPSIDSFNIVLGAYLQSGDLTGFDGVLKEVLKKKGLECNLTTYNYRISRLCKNKECVRARKVLDEMVTKGVKPNSASYNSVIDGFCRLGDFESAKKVLESMLADGHASPCSLTYYSLFRNMVREGEFDSALGVVKEILKRKWVPPFEAVEGLVNGLVKMSRTDEAKEVVEKMKKRLKGNAVQSWEKIEAALPL